MSHTLESTPVAPRRRDLEFQETQRNCTTAVEVFAGELGAHVCYIAELLTDREGSGFYDRATIDFEWNDFDKRGDSSDAGTVRMCVRVNELETFIELLRRLVDVARRDGALPARAPAAVDGAA